MDDQPPADADDDSAAATQMEMDGDDQTQPQPPQSPPAVAVAMGDADLFDVDGLLAAASAVPAQPQADFVRRQRRLIGPLWRLIMMRCGDEGPGEGQRPASPTAAPQLTLTAGHALVLLRVALSADPADAESEMLVSQCGCWWRRQQPRRLHKGPLSRQPLPVTLMFAVDC